MIYFELPQPTELPHVQAAMLRGSPTHVAGGNVEQVEIDFALGVPMERVSASWIETVRRTAIMEAAFQIDSGGVCGLVARAAVEPLETVQGIPASWDDWFGDNCTQPFDIERGLPWRAVLWPEARKLVWTFHHALLDGRSMASVVRAFSARLSHGGDPGELGLILHEPPTPGEIAAATEYHRSAFAGLEAARMVFPQDGEGGYCRARRTLGEDAANRLEVLADRMEVTPATLLTWAWGQVAARTAGVDAVAVGQVRSGEPKPGRAGFSMNTVPLVIQRHDQGPLVPVLQEFRKTLLELRAIERVSPEDLPPGIFQESGGPWPAGIIMVARGTLHHHVGNFSGIISIKIHERGVEPLLASSWIHPDLRLEVEVNGHGPRMAESLVGQWADLVSRLIEREDPALELKPVLPGAMRETLQGWESDGPVIEASHLAAAWSKAAEKFSSNPAILAESGEFDFKWLDERVRELAGRLERAGIGPGRTLGCLFKDRRHLATALLAVARAGAIQVALDPALPANRLMAILADSNPTLVLTDDAEACSTLGLPLLFIEDSGSHDIEMAPPGDPGETLSILYTSGSTGIPKGVMMVHGGVVNEALEMARLAGIGPGDRVLQFASPGFDASLEEILMTLLAGATLVPRPAGLAEDIEVFHRFIREKRITVLDLTTSYWATWCGWMLAEKETVPASVRTTIIGGERASAATVREWLAQGGRDRLLINSYGPTEASIVATVECLGGDWDEKGDPAIGRPLPGIIARITDDNGREMPPGAAGELWLGGGCLGPGYWQRPDLTASAFPEVDGRRWYRTGDRAWWDDSGKLRFLGRKDDQLKIRGTRVEPNEVIRILETFPGISIAHAGPVATPDGRVHLAAWIRWELPPAPRWPGLLAAHVIGHLPSAAVPTRWAMVEDFKLTERGKLDRSQLPEPLLTASTAVSSDPPATPTEVFLADLWSRLLDVGEVSRDEDFFELGGHSLVALQLFAGISREWKLRIPMASLIEAPTLKLLGSMIDRQRSWNLQPDPSEPVVVEMRPDGKLPPLFCIHGGDGGVIFYRSLVKLLPEGRPLLAIESPALAADEEVKVVPVEQSARDYIAALRRFQPKGPYFLAGYSYGGLLVYEISRQLIEQGEEVRFAGLFDTVNPATPMREYTLMERVEVYWNAQEKRGLVRKICRMIGRIREGFETHFRVKGEVRAARTAGRTKPHTGIRILQVREAHEKAMQNYQPEPLSCHITLFKSKAPDDKFDIPPDYGWSGLVRSMDVVEVPGSHLTMFAPRHVGPLAREVAKRL